jgi:hypothetical protein
MLNAILMSVIMLRVVAPMSASKLQPMTQYLDLIENISSLIFYHCLSYFPYFYLFYQNFSDFYLTISLSRGSIFSHVRPFYVQAVSDLDRSMHRSLWVYVAHNSFIEGSHRIKNMASGARGNNEDLSPNK